MENDPTQPRYSFCFDTLSWTLTFLLSCCINNVTLVLCEDKVRNLEGGAQACIKLSSEAEPAEAKLWIPNDCINRSLRLANNSVMSCDHSTLQQAGIPAPAKLATAFCCPSEAKQPNSSY